MFVVLPLRHAFVRQAVGQASGLTVPGTSGSADAQPRQTKASETPLTGRAETCPTTLARAWLKCGLETFGLGAKTAAGYGWFDCSKEIQNTIPKALKDRADKEIAEKARLAEEQRRKVEEADRQRKTAELKAATANMTPEQKADFEIKDWDDSRLKNHFDRFAKLTPEQQGAVYRLLRGSKSALWIEIRKLAQAGNVRERSRWGTFTQAIFPMAKQRGEKMP